MTDERAALLMRAKLLGETIGFVCYSLPSGERVEIPVVGSETVVVPRSATNAWYSWEKPADRRQAFSWKIHVGQSTAYNQKFVGTVSFVYD